MGPKLHGGRKVRRVAATVTRRPSSESVRPKPLELTHAMLSSGRTLSVEFMELPNKKQWAVYYKAIKHPQCLENVFVRTSSTLDL